MMYCNHNANNVKCTELLENNSMHFCKLHRCNHGDCQKHNRADTFYEKILYCSEHKLKCNVYECIGRTSKTYCRSHICSSSNKCDNICVLDSKFCSLHLSRICRYKGCVNSRIGMSEKWDNYSYFCEDHKCIGYKIYCTYGIALGSKLCSYCIENKDGKD